MADENFTINMGAEDLAKITPNEGGAFKRTPFGNYKFRIVDCVQQAKEGKNPHVMLKPTFVILEAREPENAHAVGDSIDGLYAGSRESPKFMQQRLACLIRACNIQLGAGQQLSKSHFIGREFDATVVWELSKPVFDEATGNTKRYVNERVIAERPVNQGIPAGVDAKMASRDSIAYLEEAYGEASTAGTNGTAAPSPWEAQPDTAAQPSTIPVASGYRPESEVIDNQIHEYRAFYRLGTPAAEQAKSALVAAGFDPDGPVDPEKLTTNKAAWLAKFPAQPGTAPAPAGLPPLGGAAPKGTRAKASK